MEDEKVLWYGKPTNRFSLPYTTLTIISGVLFSLFALTINVFLFDSNVPLIIKLIAILFLLFGIAKTFLPFILHSIRRERTYYSITTERIFVEYWFFRRRIRSFKIQFLPLPKIRNYADGLGTILVNYEKPWSYKPFTVFIDYSWRDQFRRLELIDNPDHVLKLLTEQRSKLVVTTDNAHFPPLLNHPRSTR